MKGTSVKKGEPSAQPGDAGIKEVDWRGKRLSQLRVLIRQADPVVVEERK